MPRPIHAGLGSADAFDETERFSFATVVRPLMRRLPLLLLVAAGAGAITLKAQLSTKRRYAASVSLSTVSTNRIPNLAVSFPASLLSGGAIGLQPTPSLIARLAQSRSVLLEVAHAVAPDDSGRTVVQRLKRGFGPTTPDFKVYDAMRRAAVATVDRETGMVTLTVMHVDSALARFATGRLVSEVTAAFRRAARAQATQLRVAQERRVDSTERQLRHAEEQLMRFAAANRVVAPYSLAAVERDRLARGVSLTQSVYTQAVMEREAALAKELEETPAVVVVEPIPRQLVPVARQTVLKVFAATLAALVAASMLVIIRDASRRTAPAPAEPSAVAGASPRRPLAGSNEAAVR